MNNADTESSTEETVKAEAQQAVGQLLRETREQAGLEIAEVARVLRISQRYLEALEGGRDEDLPGTTYAIGFVRSYAEHLNLSGEEIVRRYKAEAEGVGVKTDLVFPKPIPDGGVPGAAVLGLGVILAAVAYGVWYWNSNAENMIVARVEAVPEHMAAPVEEAPAPKATKASAPPATSTPEAVPEVEAAVEADAEEVASAVSEQAQQEVEPQVETAPEVEAAVQEVQETVEAAAAEEPVVEEIAAVAEQEIASATEEATPSEAVPAKDGASRITVRAKSNSWIQVRDEALDRLLFTRLLREGDEYEVPNRAGLRLMTGNAGALELWVDGEAIPAIGEVGEVRRNVELDPEKLKSGTAVTE